MSVSGGKSQGVYVVTDAEIASGAFRVAPGPAIRVTGMAAATRGVEGGPLTPVYVVTDPAARGVEGGKPIPMSNLMGIRLPVHDLAIPIYVVADDGQFVTPVVPSCLSALCQATIGYWKMDETSGIPANSVVGSPGIDHYGGTVASAAGKIGNARGQFSGTNFFRATDNLYSVINSATQSFTVWAWYKPDVSSGSRGLFGVDNGVNDTNRSWQVITQTSLSFMQLFYSPTQAIFAVSPVHNVGAWNLVIYKFDHTTQRVRVSLNGGAWVTSASALPSAMVTNASWNFQIGVFAGSFGFNGLLDEMGFALNHAATDDDRDFLYNSGAGVTYADIEAYED